MDIADQAQLEMPTEEELRSKINLKPDAPAVGVCLDCGEPLPDKQRWCDKVCLDAWQHRQDLRKLK